MSFEHESPHRAEMGSCQAGWVGRSPARWMWGFTKRPSWERVVPRSVMVHHEDVNPLSHQIGHFLVGVGPAVERYEGRPGFPASRGPCRSRCATVAVARPPDRRPGRQSSDPARKRLSTRTSRAVLRLYIDVIVAQDDHLSPGPVSRP